LKNTGRPQEAAAAYQAARALEQQLATDFPDRPDYRQALAKTLKSLAGVCHARQEFSRARAFLEQAEPHLRAAREAVPTSPPYRRTFRTNRAALAAALAGLNDPVAAVATAEQLARLGWDPAEDTYQAACALARCAAVTASATALPEAERNAR